MSARTGWFRRAGGSGPVRHPGQHRNEERGIAPLRGGPPGGPVAIVVAVLVFGLVLGTVLYLSGTPASRSSADPQAQCPAHDTVQLAVDPALHDVVGKVLAKIRRPCVSVEETSQASGNGAFAYSRGADLPDVWIPDSELWLTRTFLGRPGRFRVVDPAVASTPVLLVGGPGPGSTTPGVPPRPRDASAPRTR